MLKLYYTYIGWIVIKLDVTVGGTTFYNVQYLDFSEYNKINLVSKYIN